MSVIRTYHDKNNPYTLIANQALFDKTLSNAARGLWAQCMARKEDWVFYVSEIIKHTTDGKTAIYNQIDELIRAGYVLRLQVKEKKAKKLLFKSVDYIFFETKVDEQKKAAFLEEFKKSFPHSCFLDTESPDTENQQLVNTNTKKILTSENPPLSSPPSEPPSRTPSKVSLRSEEEEIPNKNKTQAQDVPVYPCLKETNLSPKEKQRLCRSYSQDEVVRALKISKTQPIKKSFMGLLLNILKNPDDWAGKSTEILMTSQQQIAMQYNQKLEKVEPVLAKNNEERILRQHCIKVLVRDNDIQQLSLKSFDFENDILEADRHLQKVFKQHE